MSSPRSQSLLALVFHIYRTSPLAFTPPLKVGMLPQPIRSSEAHTPPFLQPRRSWWNLPVSWDTAKYHIWSSPMFPLFNSSIPPLPLSPLVASFTAWDRYSGNFITLSIVSSFDFCVTRILNEAVYSGTQWTTKIYIFMFQGVSVGPTSRMPSSRLLKSTKTFYRPITNTTIPIGECTLPDRTAVYWKKKNTYYWNH